jgi:hypothetical protein
LALAFVTVIKDLVSVSVLLVDGVEEPVRSGAVGRNAGVLGGRTAPAT